MTVYVQVGRHAHLICIIHTLCTIIIMRVYVTFLQPHKGKGHTDGVHKDQQLFQCGVDCGMFVAINRLRQCPDSVAFEPNSPLPDAPVSVGERVVWISDKGPESGTVRWVGVLHDCKTGDLTVGVEFVSTHYHNSMLNKHADA